MANLLLPNASQREMYIVSPFFKLTKPEFIKNMRLWSYDLNSKITTEH